MAITEAAVHAFHLLHLAQPGPSLAPIPPPKRRKSSSGPGEPSKTARTNRASRPRTSAPTSSLFPLVFRPTPTTIHLSASTAPVSRPGRPEGRRESRDSLPSPSPALELDAEYGRASSSGSTSSASAALPSSGPADADADDEVYELDETRIESSPPLRSSPLTEKKKRKRDRITEAKRPSDAAADQAEKAKETKPKKQKQKKRQSIELPAPAPPLPGATTIDPRFLLMPSPSSPSTPVAGLPPAVSGKKKKRHSQAGPSWVTQTPQTSSQ